METKRGARRRDGQFVLGGGPLKVRGRPAPSPPAFLTAVSHFSDFAVGGRIRPGPEGPLGRSVTYYVTLPSEPPVEVCHLLGDKLRQMLRQGGAEQGDERVVHETVVVGEAEDDDRFVAQRVRETVADAVGVFSLHAKNHVGPAEMAGGDFDARGCFRAGGAGFVAGMSAEQRFGGGAAPLVPRTEEEKFGFQHPASFWRLRCSREVSSSRISNCWFFPRPARRGRWRGVFRGWLRVSRGSEWRCPRVSSRL